MKIISIIKWNLAEIFRVTESTGKTSVEFYPQEKQSIVYKGRDYFVKLAKVEYKSKESTLYLQWTVV